jgi:hypothetical protein
VTDVEVARVPSPVSQLFSSCNGFFIAPPANTFVCWSGVDVVSLADMQVGIQFNFSVEQEPHCQEAFL